MCALLTTTMPYMKVVIDELIEKGLRDKYIVLVGGAPLNEEFGKAVGADAYCRDAAVASETAQALVLARRAAAAGEPRADGTSSPSIHWRDIPMQIVARGPDGASARACSPTGSRRRSTRRRWWPG